MDMQKKKCSTKKHLEIDAIVYCNECKKYFCNKCQNQHSEMFDEHKTIKLNNLNDTFIDICKENNHKNKLEFYCKVHNTLCCGLCISKIKEEGYGQHSDCEVYHIKYIKDEKKKKLKENIFNLEEINNQIENSINELNKIFEVINKNKEDLKLKIQTIFTKLRNVLNEKEDKLLSDVDKEFNKIEFKEDLIKETEKLPKKIKKSIDKGKLIEKEWNENNLSSLINDCIIIENNMNDINKINDNVQKVILSQNLKIKYNIEEEQITNLINTIHNFGKIITAYEISSNNCLKVNYKKKEMENHIHKLINNSEIVLCLCLLNDGRLASGSYNNSIIIYNKNTFQPDLIIKEHSGSICCLFQLNSGELISCSMDKTIKLFNINGLQYKVLQTLYYHNGPVLKILQLKNSALVSCSDDSSIIFYLKDKKEYKIDYQISTNGRCSSIIQTKDNEICYSLIKGDSICFYNFSEKKSKKKKDKIRDERGPMIFNISKINDISACLIMIKKDLLLIPGFEQLSIVNTNEYKLIRKINVPNSGWITGVCLFENNMLFTGDRDNIIRKWKIKGDNLILISENEKAHDDDINSLLNIGNGLIASCSDDFTIKIWQFK